MIEVSLAAIWPYMRQTLYQDHKDGLRWLYESSCSIGLDAAGRPFSFDPEEGWLQSNPYNLTATEIGLASHDASYHPGKKLVHSLLD